MAANPLRMPALAFGALSICLSIAIIGCAGRTLHMFDSQQKTNTWLLPIWPSHFDTRELQALIGTSAAIVFLNILLMLALTTVAVHTSVVTGLASILSLMCSIIAIAFPTVINQKAPARDTLQTWTCRWSKVDFSDGHGPSGFGTICYETRFAFFTTIPVFVIQLLLVSNAAYAIIAGRSRRPARLGSDAEKGQGHHELGDVSHAAFDTKSEGSLVSASDTQKAGIVSTKAV